MLKINNIKEYTIDYTCTCGVNGECMFKPPKGNAIIVVSIKCPMCGETERLKIMKYDSEESRKQLSDEADLYWAVVIDNKVKDNYNV